MRAGGFMKYFLNFKLINKNKVKVIFIKEDNSTYFNGGINYTFDWQTNDDQKVLHQKLIQTINKLPEHAELITNVILDDSLFSSLSVKKMILKINKNEINVDHFRDVRLTRIMDSKLNIELSQLGDNNFYVHYPYIVTILKDNNLKVYRKIPTNKEFDVITQYLNLYSFNKNEPVFVKIQNLLKQLKISKTNYLFRSQIIASTLNELKKPTLSIDLNSHYLNLNVINFGRLDDYQKLTVGTANYLSKLTQIVSHLNKEELLMRLQYINKLSNSNLNKELVNDLNLRQLKYSLDQFMKVIANLINQRLKEFSVRNNGKILTRLAFSGELAWIVDYLTKYFETNFQNLEVEIMRSNTSSEFQFSWYKDKLIEQAVLLSNKFTKDNDQVQTQTSQIDLERITTKTFFQKIKEFIFKGV
ncbi:hypothetical protein D1113_01550 [Mycoplasmopsis gallopavonis]|uniref:Cell division protein FtsA n=2 Tax=Mycoplasmopsis gallopavonis TaxID=76629 RepID=A0A449AZB8_9BACT|nr:hypothetical protein D1113_01550 [Mycoplasmopsis gallopavonis]VEU72842.1 Uncharacterised protein [Mycoplasmopsis gallopavonis]